MENLDLECAEMGRVLASEADDRLLTQALGVLQEQGLYAFFLFLHSKGRNPGRRVSTACTEFLQCTPAARPLLEQGPGDTFDKLKALSMNLDDLLLARELLMQGLTYARHHAKAGSESKA